MDEQETRHEGMESLIRLGNDLRRGDKAIADLAELEQAIEMVCPHLIPQITMARAKVRRHGHQPPGGNRPGG